MSSNTGWFVPILSAVAILLATVFISPLQKVTGPSVENLSSKSAGNRSGDVQLSIQEAAEGSSEKKRRLEVKIASPTEKVTGVELVITFDPKQATIENISAGNFFEGAAVLQKEIDNRVGLVIFTLGTFSPKNGSGVLAEVQVKTRTDGARIEISSESKVTAIGKDKSVSGKVSGIQL